MAGKKISSRSGNDPKLAKAVSAMLRATGRPTGTKVVIGPYKKGRK